MISNFVANLRTERIKDKLQFSEVEGAKDFFYELKELEEFKLGIATGSWEKSAKLKLETIGIGLDKICFSNSDYHKSRESITKDVIEQLTRKNQKKPEQIIYFGDGEWDFKTCQNLGIEFIGIDIDNDGKLTELGVKNVFTNYLSKEQIMIKLKKAVQNRVA